jgi:hypothetical protein
MCGRNRIALVLCDSSKDMDRKLGGRRVVAANEVDPAGSISIAMNARLRLSRCKTRTAGAMATVDDQSLYSSMLATAALRASAHWLESFR